MNKQQLIKAFIAQLESDLATMKEAARAAHEAATHEESQPENEYDTRGLEASYLAGAQAKRAAEIDEVLALFRGSSFKAFGPNDKIQATALVELKIDEKPNTVLLMSKGGGVRLVNQGQGVQIITPQSSLGEALLGRKVGEFTDYEVAGHVRECEIVTVS